MLTLVAAALQGLGDEERKWPLLRGGEGSSPTLLHSDEWEDVC